MKLPDEPEIIEKILRTENATEVRIVDKWEKLVDLRNAAQNADAFADFIVSQFDDLAKLLPLAKSYRELRSLCEQQQGLLEDCKSMLELWPLHENTTAGSPSPTFKLVDRIDRLRSTGKESDDKAK